MRIFNNILSIITTLLILTGCTKINLTPIPDDNSPFKIIVSIGSSKSNSTDSRVSLNEYSLNWNSSDKIHIVEVENNGEFGECFEFKIDASSISSDYSTAEFTGNRLTKGKKYIAFNSLSTGSVISDKDYKISNNYVSGYGYDNFNNNFEIIMHSESFKYYGESIPSISLAPISSALTVNLSFTGDIDGIGDLKSVEISDYSGRNILLSEVVFDSNAQRIEAYNQSGSIFGATSSILAKFTEPIVIGKDKSLTVNIPLTWNSYLPNFQNILKFTFTTTKNHICSDMVSVNSLEDAGIYKVDFSFNIEDDLSTLYESTDYSKDGEVTQLQKATIGDGINLVIVGDGFTDKDMKEYDIRMNQAMEFYFSEEPYSTYRNRFNVYSVKAISKNDGITKSGKTVFSTEFGEGTLISGDDETVFNYALKVKEIANYKDLHVITVLNSHNYAGTCYMYTNGASIAYCPIINNNTEDFSEVVVHEAGGHGFAKLLDEYDYGGTIPNEEIEDFKEQLNYGWGANVDITANKESIQWAHLLSDSRYDSYVSIIEGALGYEKGAYRPSKESIMRHNTGGYNAPSREAIFKRIMELSGSTYSYEKFVKYDAVNRTSKSITKNTLSASKVDISRFIPLNPPILVKESYK